MVQKIDEAVVMFAISAVVVSLLARNPWPLVVIFLYFCAASAYVRKR